MNLRSAASCPSFTALDFETANQESDSACAIGLVRVEGGRVVERAAHLIRPPTRRFTFTHVHGLRWEDVAASADFSALWYRIQRFFRGVSFVAAHNAPFDEGVLRACCQRAGVPAPRVPFECTVRMARRVWGIYPTRLNLVAERLGIPLRHHDAASDADACASIVLRAHGL